MLLERRHNRAPVNRRFGAIAIRGGRPTRVSGRCKDVSEGGLSAVLEAFLEIDEVVALDLPGFHAGEPLRPHACVRYRNGNEYGFEFVTLSATEREHIRRIIELQPVPHA
jgi:c-di-GMP-binding flagellar brake protein YcgR